MKFLIYQYWNGKVPPIAIHSRKNMERYAALVGADYRFDHNENSSRTYCDDPKYFGLLRPVYDTAFHEYDRVLFLDSDVFARHGVTQSIFTEPLGDFGMCEEPHMPAIREFSPIPKAICFENDKKWAHMVESKWGIIVPRDGKRRPLVFNTGVVMFSKGFMKRALSVLVPPQEYINETRRCKLPPFYGIDQNYLHAMAFMSGIDFTVLSQEWNRQVHYVRPDGIYDERTPATKFVHVQLSGSNDWDEEKTLKTVNA